MKDEIGLLILLLLIFEQDMVAVWIATVMVEPIHCTARHLLLHRPSMAQRAIIKQVNTTTTSLRQENNRSRETMVG